MNKKIKDTEWAKKFLIECPTAYNQALERAGEPVEIFRTNETGEWQWVVSTEDGFWMDGFKTKRQAKQLVADMGWPEIE